MSRLTTHVNEGYGLKSAYQNIHQWLRRYYGSSNSHYCAIDISHDGKKHWANIDGIYDKNINHFLVLCVACHRGFDNTNPSRYIVEKIKEVSEKKLITYPYIAKTQLL